MTRIFRITKLAVLLCLLGATARADETERIKSAVVKGIALLQPCDEIFFNNTGCIACHQQSITAMAVEKARSLGIQVDEQAAKTQRDLIDLALRQIRAGRLQRVENPFVQPAVTGFYSLAFEAQGYEPNENTDAIAIDMAGRQTPDGFWIAFTHRPPIEYSKIKSTAFAIKTMLIYGPPSHREQFQKRIDKARQWLLKSEPRGNEEEVFRLLGLAWSKAAEEEIKKQSDELISMQQSDGGWKQLSHLKSDAYATSMALYALHEAGMQSTDLVYRKGVNYLLDTQLDDGSWFVKSRSSPVQAYFESGFPHETDQWISATATGWACVVLMDALPE